MKIIIGLRRLYDAVGCSLGEVESRHWEFSFINDYRGVVYMGPKPQFGIYVHSDQDKFCIPGETTSYGHFSYYADATKSNYPRNFFFEVIAGIEAEVDSKLYQDAVDGVPEARDCLVSMSIARQSEFESIIDYIAGAIGVRCHRQFVLEEISENPFAFVGEKPVLRFASPSVETLEALRLNSNGVHEVEMLLKDLATKNKEEMGRSSNALAWLARAWQMRDNISKFIAFFIPIECVLDKYSVSMPADIKTKAAKIRKILKKYPDAETELLPFFNSHFEKYHPSLEERFAKMAEAAGFAGWEADVVAFSHFNKMRNDLVHRGDTSISLHSTPNDNDLRTLEDIAERYVSYALFGDGKVYQSRFRPDR